MTARVASVEIDIEDGELVAEITLRRTSMYVLTPPVDDVPPDVRNALQAWLDGAKRPGDRS